MKKLRTRNILCIVLTLVFVFAGGASIYLYGNAPYVSEYRPADLTILKTETLFEAADSMVYFDGSMKRRDTHILNETKTDAVNDALREAMKEFRYFEDYFGIILPENEIEQGFGIELRYARRRQFVGGLPLKNTVDPKELTYDSILLTFDGSKMIVFIGLDGNYQTINGSYLGLRFNGSWYEQVDFLTAFSNAVREIVL